MSKELLEAAEQVLMSGDDTGCDGLVVVGLEEFLALREVVGKMTGHYLGSVNTDYDFEDEDEDEENDE